MELRILDSHLSADDLAKYGNGKTFVETGTYMGDTVYIALDAGFTNVVTIEINEELWNRAKNIFSHLQVECILGDSVDAMGPIVEKLEGPVTFWLDAHASGPLPGGRTGGSPLEEELKAIAKSPCKEHTILIDDKRLFGSAEWSFVKEETIMNLLKEINPNYKIILLDGVIEKDIICATVK